MKILNLFKSSLVAIMISFFLVPVLAYAEEDTVSAYYSDKEISPYKKNFIRTRSDGLVRHYNGDPKGYLVVNDYLKFSYENYVKAEGEKSIDWYKDLFEIVIDDPRIRVLTRIIDPRAVEVMPVSK
jgi:hypothetical protein